MKRVVMFLISASLALVVVAQRQVQQLADSVVKYQMKSGGWPKNQDWLKGVDAKEAKAQMGGCGLDEGTEGKVLRGFCARIGVLAEDAV